MKTRRVLQALMLLAGLALMAGSSWAQDEDAERPDEAVGEPGESVEESEVSEEAPELLPTVPEPVRPARPQPVRSRPVLPPRGTGRAQLQPPKSGPPRDNSGPKDGRTPDTPVSFDFDNVPLSNVIEAIARMTGKNFDVDPNIGTMPVTVITHDEIPPELAYQVLESILNTRGFSLMETLDGHLIRVVKTGESLEKAHFAHGTVPPPDRYDSLSTHVVGVENANAQDLATILRVLGSSSCSVDAYVPTNTLIITDTADGLRRVFSFLEEVDIPGFDTTVEIFTLEYTRAEVLSTQIEQVLSPEGAPAGAPSRPTPTPRRPVRPSSRTVPGTSAPLVIGAREEVLRIVPDERLNALIVVATEGMMERVRDLVNKLDTPTPYEANNLHVYELLNANAEDVESALNAIVGTTPRKAGPQGGAGAAGAEIQPFEKKVMITQYEQTNALLILASPQDYKLIKEIIAQLDVPTRQVHLEAVILEVSINDNFTLNVETAAFQDDVHGIIALSNVVKLANMLTQGPLAVAGAGMTAGYLDGTTDIVVPGLEGMLTPMTIPNVPLLITALENMTDIDVLSQPSLTTQDNQPANMVVGQELPVPTMRSGYTYNPREPERRTTPYGGMSSYGRGISRQDVGVKMTVTPHINEGDYVTVEVEIEVSQPVVSDVGIDPNELGPTFQKSLINNSVVVKDGTTAIIGGLISETTDHSRRQTPVLGEVPVIGWLFRSRGARRSKRNLVVLLTPHIVKEGVELERLTAYRMGEFREANLDVLFEKGFIRKIKNRSRMRNKYRPGMERSEKFDQRTGFGRGDIRR